MPKVVILQEYVPMYRRPFFEELIRKAKIHGLEIVVAGGLPNKSQAERGDSVSADFVLPIRQREVSLGKKRLVLRRVRPILQDADMVILEQARRNIDSYLLLGRAKRTELVALWGHGHDYVKKASRLERSLQRFLARKADWFFAYTDKGAMHAVQLGVPIESVTVVKNSVDTRAITAGSQEITEEDVRSFKRKMGLGDRVAVFIGGLDSSKRIPFLLEAALIASSLDDQFSLLVVGDGDDRHLVEDAAYRCPSIVHTGALQGHDKVVALISSQMIAMPGRVGLVAVDSFAAGRPIITTDWPFHAPEFEYLTSGVDAVVTANDATAFAKAMLSLSNDDIRLREMQRACRRKSDEYSIEAMTDRYLDGILNALSQGRRV